MRLDLYVVWEMCEGGGLEAFTFMLISFLVGKELGNS